MAARVRAAGHRRRRRQQADAAVARRRDGLHRLGLDHAEHVDAERRLRHPLAQRRQRRRRRRVAGDDEQLRAAREQLLGDLQREALELGLRAGRRRGSGPCRQVEEVLVRQLHEQLVQHGEPADAGVEDGDRARARVARSVMPRGHGRAARRPGDGRQRTQPFLLATPSIVDLSFSTRPRRCRCPSRPPRRARRSRTARRRAGCRATYSTVPCPAVPAIRARAHSAAACARPMMR